MKIRWITYVILFTSQWLYAQQFQNSDLDGVINGLGCLPYNWQNVPFGDPHCMAFPGSLQATVDLTGVNGPNISAGINGNPYSGSTFVSGHYATAHTGSNLLYCWHEGIQQTVSGFSVGCTYTINFFQSVVKQINCLDSSGFWAVYIDTTLIGNTQPTYSSATFASNNFTWDFRQVSFIATKPTHTIKFLPMDDDTISEIVPPDYTALRMGIDSIYITHNQLSVSQQILGNDTSLCNIDSLIIQPNIAGNQYLWSDGSTNTSLTVYQTGQYWVRITTPCQVYTDTITINFTSLPTINIGADTMLCEGDSLQLHVPFLQASILWNTGASDTTLVIKQAGNYWVNIEANGCYVRDTIEITSIPLPICDLGNDTLLCGLDQFIIHPTATAPYYQWSDASNASFLTVTQGGTYWLTMLNHGCAASDTIHIAMQEKPVINLGADTSICEGDTIVLDATVQGATSYMWTNQSAQSSIQVSTPGNYAVWVTLGNCTTLAEIEVDLLPTPIIQLTNDAFICAGESTAISIRTNADSWIWNTLSTAPSIQVNMPGVYWVQASLQNCTATDTAHIFQKTEGCMCDVFLPTAFTPNHDLLNDEYKPINISAITLNHFVIYNRWGQIVFQNKHAFDWAWDGNFAGVPADIGTYFYVLSYTCTNNQITYHVKGDFTLIR